MSRKLPPSDTTPDWLPAGWISHSTVSSRGRETRTYTNSRTRKKFSTKDQVLEYLRMVEIREKRKRTKESVNVFEDSVSEGKRPLWLPDGWETELRIGRYGGNQYTMYVNMASGFKTNLKHKVLEYENTMELESESEAELLEEVDETGNEYITYDYDMDEEDLSENEFVLENVEDSSNVASTPIRSQPERMQKLESRAKTQCVFEDEDISDSEKKLPEAKEGCNEANASGQARVGSHLVESKKNLPDEICLECEPASDNLVETVKEETGTRNIEIIDLDSEDGEETGNESRRSVFFPHREAPSHSVLVFENSKARSCPEDLMDTIGLGLNTQEKNLDDSKKRKKNKETCSPKNTKKKDAEAPTEKLRKGKKRSSSVGVEEKPIEWPEPCPYFPFEPLTRTLQVADDSVICKYLEDFAAAGSGDNALPDFGLPSFFNLKVSVDEEHESKKKKSPGKSMGTTNMQHTVAGN